MYCTIAVNSALRAKFNCSMTFSLPCMVLPSVLAIVQSSLSVLREQGRCDPEHTGMVEAHREIRGQNRAHSSPKSMILIDSQSLSTTRARVLTTPSLWSAGPNRIVEG